MVSCAWCGRSKTDKTKKLGITFHHFPKNPDLRSKWANIINKNNWIPSRMNVLCSQHFKESCFDRTSLAKVRLRENAVPSIKIDRLKYVKNYNTETNHSVELASLPPSREDDSLINDNTNRLLPIEEIFRPIIEDANENSTSSSVISNEASFSPSRTPGTKAKDTPTEIHLKRKIQELQTSVKLKSKQLRLIQNSCWCQKNKINSLMAIICELRKRNC
ncbi:hypothetical protein ILUMI_04965 [Ignelater luminosus]|uniref:THAP-type domain-containing protein n=1 Tax=Ignelater luminosus TaxID=2038154 RepID=A0A8K0DD90_IGNLU|nr:hypothetical protein ILUMI_04965 [Ignelater luminosus]